MSADFYCANNKTEAYDDMLGVYVRFVSAIRCENQRVSAWSVTGEDKPEDVY